MPLRRGRMCVKLQQHTLTDSQIDMLRGVSQTDFWFFLHCILQASSWLTREVQEPICSFLEKPIPVKDLMGFRGCLKTTILGGLAVWHSIRDSMVSVMLGSKIDRNAASTVRLAKSYWEKNDLIRVLFPELVPDFSKSQWSDYAATITRPFERRDPTYCAIGLGTTVTTRHPNVLILDDAVSAEIDQMTGEEAVPSQEDVEKAIGFWRMSNTLVTSSKETPGQKVNVGTRWALNDLSQWIRENEVDYISYDLPIVNEQGEPVWPVHGDGTRGFDLARIQQLRESMGPYMFSGQYMLNPLPIEKMKFMPEWLQRFENMPKETPYFVYICTDPAISQSKKADFTGIAIVAVTPDDHRWVLEERQERVLPNVIVNLLCDTVERYRKDKWCRHVAAVVETNAFQQALVYSIRDEVKRRGMNGFVIHEYNVRAAKDTRILGLVPYASSGKLHLRTSLSSLPTQMLQYPRGRHKHLLDALSQHVAFAHAPSPDYVAEKRPDQMDPMSMERIRWEMRKEAQRVVDDRWMESDTVWKGEEVGAFV